jgi:hypothetical protein
VKILEILEMETYINKLMFRHINNLLKKLSRKKTIYNRNEVLIPKDEN